MQTVPWFGTESSQCSDCFPLFLTSQFEIVASQVCLNSTFQYLDM